VSEMGAKHGFKLHGSPSAARHRAHPRRVNVLPAIGVYSAIRREKGEPFSFPGGPSFVWEAADADLVADMMVWAGQSPQAANEAFNITNGDVFEWRNLWPALAKLSVSKTGTRHANERGSLPRGKRACLGPDRREVTGFVPKPTGVGWPRGPARGLRVRLWRSGRASSLRELPSSCVRLGSPGRFDTENSFRNALRSLIDHKLLPPAAK